MKNLKDVNKFVLAKPGEALSLVEGEFPREVRLEVNAESACHLALRTDAGEPRFLAVVEGRETVLFTIEGPTEVWPTCDGQVWWWTVELEDAAVVSDAETYTKIAERRARNPELERVARKMQENADRRMAALMREMDAKFASLKPVEVVKDEPAAVVPAKGGRKPAKKDDDGGNPPPPKDDGGDGDEAAA